MQVACHLSNRTIIPYCPDESSTAKLVVWSNGSIYLFIYAFSLITYMVCLLDLLHVCFVCPLCFPRSNFILNTKFGGPCVCLPLVL